MFLNVVFSILLDTHEDNASSHVPTADCTGATSLHLITSLLLHNMHGGQFTSPVVVFLVLSLCLQKHLQEHSSFLFFLSIFSMPMN